MDPASDQNILHVEGEMELVDVEEIRNRTHDLVKLPEGMNLLALDSDQLKNNINIGKKEDCVRHILTYLEIVDVANLAATFKRLRNFTNDVHFPKKKY